MRKGRRCSDAIDGRQCVKPLPRFQPCRLSRMRPVSEGRRNSGEEIKQWQDGKYVATVRKRREEEEHEEGEGQKRRRKMNKGSVYYGTPSGSATTVEAMIRDTRSTVSQNDFREGNRRGKEKWKRRGGNEGC
jgi:hypothetical protein